MSKTKGLLFLFALLVLPFIVWFYLFLSKHNFKKLEIIGSKTPVPNAQGGVDTIYHNVFSAYPNFRFANQNGDTLTWDSLRGHIFIADVFFSFCKGPCPKLSAAMAEMHFYTAQYPEIKYLSISVDPTNDSVPRLKEYADLYSADPTRWYFITGDKTELYKLAMDAFFFQADILDSAGVPIFLHDQHLRLIDKEGRIRKGDRFIDGTNPSDMKLLQEELRVLMLEYREKE